MVLNFFKLFNQFRNNFNHFYDLKIFRDPFNFSSDGIGQCVKLQGDFSSEVAELLQKSYHLMPQDITIKKSKNEDRDSPEFNINPINLNFLQLWAFVQMKKL